MSCVKPAFSRTTGPPGPTWGREAGGALTRNTLAYLRLFAGMDFMFSKFYIFVTYSCFDYSLKEY